MEYRKLGRSDIDVSLICLGTMTWGEQNTEADAHDQLDYSLDHEVNFIDTAEIYAVPTKSETQGLTEKYIGKVAKCELSAISGVVPMDGVEQEFNGALNRVIEQMQEQQLNELLVKAKRAELADDEKVSLTKLLAIKREQV